jgi:Asp/Glu/hydantoin racemase
VISNYEKHGYEDRVVAGWKGRSVYGATVGIIQLPANIPMLPGDMGNPTTFDFPVLYELIPDIDPFWVLAAEPHPEVLKRTIIAAHRLEMQGCRAIIGNCGFFANYQPEVAQAITVPFFNGSLMQVPMALVAVGSNKKVGVLTANGKLLKASPALKNSGVHAEDMSRVVIYGNEDGKEMNNVTGEKGTFSPKGLEKELVDLAKKCVDEHPDVGAIVLECTEFPPHAFAIQEAVRLPMYDFVTLTKLMHAGAMQKPYTGWM